MAVNPNKALWEKGDFTRIASSMRDSGETVAKVLGAGPQHHILDLGCGDGTTAIPLARTGARVTGIDIARNLVTAGNQRARDLGLQDRLTFQEGDACTLEGVHDHSFDMTLTVFGAMFAPKPIDVAKQMVRVTKPGGRIVMGNWIPNDPTSFVSQLLKISASYLPPPAENAPPSPMLWGVDTHIIDRFGQAGVPQDKITLTKDTFYFIEPNVNHEQFMDLFRQWYGPTMNAYDAAGKAGKTDQLHQELIDLAKRFNTNSTGRGVHIPATFMRVEVKV